MRSSAVILVLAFVLWSHAGQVGSAPAAAAEPPAVPQEKKAAEKIRVGDMVVVVADEAEVTWEGKVIARIPRGGAFRVLRVSRDEVAGWIAIQNRQDIEWTKRGHEVGWVRLDQVARAKPNEINPAAPPVARAAPPLPTPPSSAAPTVPRTTLPAPDTAIPPPPAHAPARTAPVVPGTLKVDSGRGGHFACNTLDGKDRDLCAAVSDNQRDEVARLLAAGANINARSIRSHTKSMTLLMLAVWYRWDREVIKLLIESGADVNARDNRGNTALIFAAEVRPQVDLDLLELLVKGRADVNAKGEDGMTALMHAVMHDDVRLAKRLIEVRADVAARDAGGWTALMHAARKDRGNPAMIELLFKAGADVNTVHNRGGTALSIACYGGHAKAVTLLLKAGAEVNTRDEAGWTPLICACIESHTPIVKLLLAAGADVHARDKTRRTPLRVASDLGDGETVRALIGAGAAEEDRPTRKAGTIDYGGLRRLR